MAESTEESTTSTLKRIATFSKNLAHQRTWIWILSIILAAAGGYIAASNGNDHLKDNIIAVDDAGEKKTLTEALAEERNLYSLRDVKLVRPKGEIGYFVKGKLKNLSGKKARSITIFYKLKDKSGGDLDNVLAIKDKLSPNETWDFMAGVYIPGNKLEPASFELKTVDKAWE